MASWVGFAKKHNVAVRTDAQRRESDRGGKLADDHFQRLFLGGSGKIFIASSTITPAVGSVMGSGTGTIYTITSDTVDGPPVIEPTVGQTLYNPTANTYGSGDVLFGMDTGRSNSGFYVIYFEVPAFMVSSGVYPRTTTITEYNGATDPRVVTTAELLGGVIQRTSGAGITFELPTAAAIVAAIAGAGVGTTIKFIVSNGTANTIFVDPETGSEVASLSPLNGQVSKEYTIVLTNVGSGTEAYKIYEVSED